MKNDSPAWASTVALAPQHLLVKHEHGFADVAVHDAIFDSLPGASMYYKRPYKDNFELVAVTRVYVLEKNRVGDLEVRFEPANGETLNHVYTLARIFHERSNDPRSLH